MVGRDEVNDETGQHVFVGCVEGTAVALDAARVPTAPSTNSSCVASDPYDDIWVCDANAGQLLRIPDVY